MTKTSRICKDFDIPAFYAHWWAETAHCVALYAAMKHVNAIAPNQRVSRTVYVPIARTIQTDGGVGLNSTETRIMHLGEAVGRLKTFRTAISLHSHTHHSRESLAFLPYYTNRIPVIERLVQSRLKDYEERHGKAIDLGQAHWTPPVSPEMVLASEASQIERNLDLPALVSITDHDSITAGLLLDQQGATGSTPISVEWSIPFAGNVFHVGAHCLPRDRCREMMQELSDYTAEPNEARLGDLFAHLESSRETLLVLNHPCSDFVKVGVARHGASLQQFMARFRAWIHALEFNGMRPWRENQAVMDLAAEYDLPIVAGGDRHGFRPNTMLNLSAAKNWGDFVAEIREGRRNEIVVLPSYDEPVSLRELATASEALRFYPHHPEGRRRFTDRVFVDVGDCGTQQLSFYWDQDGMAPPWLHPAVSVAIALGRDPVRGVLRRLLGLRGEFDGGRWPARVEYRSEALNANTASPQ